MKKTMALMICVSLIITLACLCFPVGAVTVEEEFVLHDCDAAFGGFQLDTDDYLEGTGSVRYNFLSGDSFAISTTFPAVDASGADTLAFDFYVSDESLFSHFSQCMMEVTSSGKCDQSEIAWPLNSMLSSSLEEGWNTVYLFFDDGIYTDGETGHIDLSAVNYIRIYAFYTLNDIKGETIKFDNIRLCKTGGDNYSDMNLDAYLSDNKGVNVKVSGVDEKLLENRDGKITQVAGKKIGATETDPTGNGDEPGDSTGCNASLGGGAALFCFSVLTLGGAALKKKGN